MIFILIYSSEKICMLLIAVKDHFRKETLKMNQKMWVVMVALASLCACSSTAQATSAPNADVASNMAYRMVSDELQSKVSKLPESWVMCPINGAVIIRGVVADTEAHAVITEDRPGAKGTTYSVALSQKQFDPSLCMPVSTKAVRAALAKTK